MVNIGRLLLDPNFKIILSIGKYLRLIVMYWEASQNLRGAVNLALLFVADQNQLYLSKFLR